jgi:flagellar motor switch protein FliG
VQKQMNNKNDISQQLKEAIRLSFLEGFKEGTMGTITTLYRVLDEHMGYSKEHPIMLILRDMAKTHYPEKTIEEYINEVKAVATDLPQILN